MHPNFRYFNLWSLCISQQRDTLKRPVFRSGSSWPEGCSIFIHQYCESISQSPLQNWGPGFLSCTEGWLPTAFNWVPPYGSEQQPFMPLPQDSSHLMRSGAGGWNTSPRRSLPAPELLGLAEAWADTVWQLSPARLRSPPRMQILRMPLNTTTKCKSPGIQIWEEV